MSLRSALADTRPLQHKAFRRLWWANIITVIGAQLTVVVVPAQIYEITGSSAYVGLTGVFGLVPLVVFGLWGGALADALDRRTLLLVSTIGLIATSALLTVQAASGNANVWLLLIIFAVQQAFFAINQPTRSAVLPRILPIELLPAANSLNMTVMMAGANAGPLVGGAMIPVLGFAPLYLVDTICLCATLIAVVWLPKLPPIGTRVKAGLGSIVDGFRYLAGHRVLLMSFLVDIIAMVFGMPRALFPQMAHENFGGPTDGGLAFALLFAAIPAGAVLGGVFSGWVSRIDRHGVAVTVSIAVWGLAMCGFGLAVGAAGGGLGLALVVALLMLMIGGIADMVSAAFRTTMLQSAANDEVRGRLQGVFTVVVAGGPRIADVLHGGAAASVGAPAAAAGGGALVVIALVVAVCLVPGFWRYRAERQASAPVR